MNVSPLASPYRSPSVQSVPPTLTSLDNTPSLKRNISLFREDALESRPPAAAKVSHLTLHPNAAITIQVDEKEVLAMMWRGFSKGATSATKKSWVYQRIANYHFNTYVKSVLREGNTDAVRSQVSKVDTVLPGGAERITSRPSHWPFSIGDVNAPKAPPRAQDMHEAASIWAQLGGAIEKQTRNVPPKAETRQTRNAESLVGSWIERAEAYLAPQTETEVLQKSTQDKLRTQLDLLHRKWAA